MVLDAASGDTILVGPGTYYEHIPIEGKSLTFLSTEGRDVTVLDGGMEIDGRQGSLIYTAGGPADLRIDGFTFRNGTGAQDWLGIHAGGAICWWSKEPGIDVTITNCIFHDNRAEAELSARGGAIGINGTTTCVVGSCQFFENYAAESGGSVAINGGSQDGEPCRIED